MAIRKIQTGAVLFSFSGEREYGAEWFPTLELAKADLEAAKQRSIEEGDWDEEAQTLFAINHCISAVGPDGPNVEGEILGAHDEDWNVLEVWAFDDSEENAEEAWEAMEEAHPEAMVAWYREPQ